jgi:hypothetical protein
VQLHLWGPKRQKLTSRDLDPLVHVAPVRVLCCSYQVYCPVSQQAHRGFMRSTFVLANMGSPGVCTALQKERAPIFPCFRLTGEKIVRSAGKVHLRATTIVSVVLTHVLHIFEPVVCDTYFPGQRSDVLHIAGALRCLESRDVSF